MWLVENGMAREVVCTTFSEWLTDEMSRQDARLAAGNVEREEDDEDDPHRLLDYSLQDHYGQDPYTAADLGLVWVQEQEGGVAEVILNNSKASYAGPWTRIRPDGTTMD